jgi:hypothetical protein
MELKKRSKIMAIIGTVVVACTLLILGLSISSPFEFRDFLGFICIIFSEIVFFFGMMAVDRLAESRGQFVLRAGGGVVITVYAFLVFGLSLLFILLSGMGIRLFCIIQVLFFMIGFITLFLLISVSKEVKRAGDS